MQLIIICLLYILNFYSDSDHASDSDATSQEYNPSLGKCSEELEDDDESSDASTDSENYTSEQSDTGSEQSTGTDESSGKDWSDLEEQARKDDKARDYEDEDTRRVRINKKRPITAHGIANLNKKRRVNIQN